MSPPSQPPASAHRLPSRPAFALALASSLILALPSPLSARAPDGDADAAPDASPPEALARLVAKEAKGAAFPAGSAPSAGRWTLSPEDGAILLHPAPLTEGALEFGPEIRERGAAILALAHAPGEGRLRSRMGVGLYGHNGFQVRTNPALERIELVRRGEVVTETPASVSPEGWYWIELAVEAAAGSDAGDGQAWEVSARLWPREGERPAEPQLHHRSTSELLRFPLAGRARLVGTAFSGTSVHFSRAEVFDAGYLKHRASAPAKGGAEDDDRDASRPSTGEADVADVADVADEAAAP